MFKKLLIINYYFAKLNVGKFFKFMHFLDYKF